MRSPRSSAIGCRRLRSGTATPQAGLKRNALTCERVTVHLPEKEDVPSSVVCDRCGEPFLTMDPAVDRSFQPCRGDTYYSRA